MDAYQYVGATVPASYETTTTSPKRTPYKPLPSQEYLREALDYDSETGVFTWRERPRRHYKSDKAHRIANKKFAGKTAGAISNGYVRINLGRLNGQAGLYLAHRLAWKITNGTDPGFLDHLNGDRKDNCLANLREACKGINARNAALSKKNKSGVSGVSYCKRHRRWKAEISNSIYLGFFASFFEAVCVRKSAELKYGYDSMHGRTAEERAARGDV